MLAAIKSHEAKIKCKTLCIESILAAQKERFIKHRNIGVNTVGQQPIPVNILTVHFFYHFSKYLNMKPLALFSSVIFLLISCSKNNDSNSYKVKYVVSGDSVNQFKITVASTDQFVKSGFSGTRDTTVYVQAGTNLKLDTKGNNSNLTGSIYVNDVLAVTGTDTDLDTDLKTEVKLDYTVGSK